MNYKNILAFAFLLVAIGAFTIITQRPWQVGASVRVGDQYQSTTTPTAVDLTNLCPARVGMASSTTGVLGSIVLTGPNIGSLHIYDATTSNETLRTGATATSSLLLGEIPARLEGNATSTAQTYTFDIEFNNGLLVDKVGLVPTSTITYRCEG